MATLIGLVVIALVAWRAMSKEQRIAMLRAIDVALTTAKEHGRDDLARFNAARRARARWVIVTAALAAANVAIFLWGPNAQAAVSVPGADALAWGASFGPLTSNGEWWRLVTAMFVNRRLVLLLVNVAALVQVGLTLERLAGPLAFGIVYFAAGILAGLAGLSAHPMSAIAGPAGAIWGLYGMLAAVAVRLWRRQSDLRLPLAEIERLAAVAAVFAVANLLDRGEGGVTQLAGLAAGIFLGVGVARDAAARSVPARRAAIAGGVALAIAVAWAAPLKGVLDIRPEIDRVVEVEQKTAGRYQAASEQFRTGRVTVETLTALIDRSIVPDLQAAAARLDALRGVPPEDAPRVADAREFLRRRVESWQLREQALRLTEKSVNSGVKSAGDSDASFRERVQGQYATMLMANGKADGAELASLAALRRLQQAPAAAAR
jgi:membrane associated rhomboid family serine protease